MPTVYVLNNYPLDRVWREVNLKETPDHHLFGINYFPLYGYDVKIVDGSMYSRSLLTSIGRSRFLPSLGDLAQQRVVVEGRNDADVIYAPCATQTNLLQYLRAVGLWKVPIVCLGHHPRMRGRLDFLRVPLFRAFARGADAIPCLSRTVVDDYKRGFGAAEKAISVSWGPDLDYYPDAEYPGRGAIAAGRTGRDFVTFGVAASKSSSRATIICLGSRPGYQDFAPNVQVLPQDERPPVPGEKSGWMKYPELIQHYQSHRVIAIPMHRQRSLAGLTSLMDAMGLGKPVIMTRNANIDIDIEREQIGLWVEAGDIDGWVKALRWFDDHPDEASEMGRRARRIAMGGVNSTQFANRIVSIFDRLLGRERGDSDTNLTGASRREVPSQRSR